MTTQRAGAGLALLSIGVMAVLTAPANAADMCVIGEPGVPAAGPWALAGLGLVVAGVGTVAARRRGSPNGVGLALFAGVMGILVVGGATAPRRAEAAPRCCLVGLELRSFTVNAQQPRGANAISPWQVNTLNSSVGAQGAVANGAAKQGDTHTFSPSVGVGMQTKMQFSDPGFSTEVWITPEVTQVDNVGALDPHQTGWTFHRSSLFCPATGSYSEATYPKVTGTGVDIIGDFQGTPRYGPATFEVTLHYVWTATAMV